jgi:cold shock CspA family protein
MIQVSPCSYAMITARVKVFSKRRYVMPKGTVKWFNFHASSIVGDKGLWEGDRVTFQVEQGEKAPRGVAVR